ncbi:MAG: GGDEF domain-containing protein [Sinimarinibacterium sp.]|jgi:diguanylate cyclase (GGDEF)-like protein
MAVVLDMPTVVLNTGLSAIYAMIAMAYVWRVHQREPAVRYWAAGFLGIAIGALLVGLRAQLPPLWTVLVGNTLIVVGNCLMYAGTALFTRRPLRWPVVAGVCAATALAMAWWGLVRPDFVWRLTFFSVGMCIPWLLMIVDLERSGQGPHRRTHRFVAAIYWICIAATAIRVVDAWLDPSVSQLFAGGWVQSLWFAAGQAVIFFSPFGFLLMTSQRLQLRLDRLANEDELTGVLNRRAFLARALELLATQAREEAAAILVLDLDHFKQINDRHGHAAGDAVLRSFAQGIAIQLRPDDLFARVGGEEFWVLLPATPIASALQTAERLRVLIESSDTLFGAQRLRLTVSIGVSEVRLGDISSALSAADRALYAAKSQGRNRVVQA